MKLIEKMDNLTMCYDFEDKRFSFNISNVEDNSQTQINIGQDAISKLQSMLNVVRNDGRSNY